MTRFPDFWRNDGLAARLLSPAGAVYGAIARRRMRREAPRAAIPSIIVGGLTAGGDGKTPTAIALAGRLQALGERPALLTRGYGRRERDEPLLVDPERHDADAVGDEALLLARVAPTIVGVDRLASANLARTLGASVVVLDDGFHSRRIAPDLTVLAIDADYGAGNGHCLPAGPLRAPLDVQLPAVDMLVVIGDGGAGVELARRAAKPVLRARLLVEGAALADQPVVAFAGIARPAKFHRSLEEAGARLIASRDFGDHHRYTPRDVAELGRLRDRYGARLVTTEKDAVRLGAGESEPGVAILAARLVFDEPARVDLALQLLSGGLNRASSAPA